MSPPDLLGMPFPALGDWLDRLGVGRGQASRVFRGLHRHRGSLSDVGSLGRHAATVEAAGWRAPVRIEAVHAADDGAERLVFALHDGARVEGVLLPNRDHARVTLCLSSQVGCAMGCTFCATGTLGLTRHLAAGEIVGQVHAARARLDGSGRRLTRLVFMGMGEPLHNYAAVRDALRVLLDTHGDPLAARNITVSTVGRLDRLRNLADDFDGRLQLAISLHAGTDATRRRILPIAHRVSLAALRQELLARPPRRVLMVEYVVLPGINDAPAELDGVAAFVDGLTAVVNLIPFNPFPGTPFRSPTDAELRAVWQGLKARGVPNTVRWPRGRQSSGACGQLMLAGNLP